MAVGTEDEKEREKWKKSALEQEKWFGKIEDGVTRFMRMWYAWGKEASAKRHLTGEAVATEVDAEEPTGLKRKRTGGALGGGKEKPETAVEEARAAEAAPVAHHVLN